jgi:DNA polymerase-1
VPLNVPLDGLVLEEPNGPKLISFLKAMEFTSITRKVAEITDTDASAVEADTITVEGYENARGPDLDAGDGTDGSQSEGGNTPEALVQARAAEGEATKINADSYQCVRDEATLETWVQRIYEAGIVAIDTETTSLDPMEAELVGISLATEPGTACYIPLAHKEGQDDLLGGGVAPDQINSANAIEILKPVLEDLSILKIGQNMKYDWLMLSQVGIDMVGLDDTMLMSYVLDAGRGGHGMDDLAKRHLGHECISYKELTGTGKSAITFDMVEIEKATRYAAEDADVTLRLWRVLKPRLVAEKMTPVYERLERPLIKVVAKMEQRGISVDRQILSRLSGELAQAAAGLESEIHELAGRSFNAGSPKQLGEILFDEMGLPGGKKTKTGAWQTGVQVLEDLAAEGHELPRKIIGWRQLTKLKSTYTDALPGFINQDTGRVHTSYSMASTSTGRFSSSDPNLQNIPIRTAEGRKIRTAFVANKGNKLVSADYSQVELRVLAHIADIPQLKQAFADGLDIHAMTASEMFNTPIDGMDPMMRRRAKAINFGIIYGISAFGLANQLSIGRSEASEYIKTYFERFPGIKDYMEETKSFAREHGYVETIFGRQAHYPGIKDPNPQMRAFNERAAINAPIQGSAADIIRRAMVRMDGALHDENLSAKMLLQVHDELIFEVPEHEVDQTIALVKDVMENATMPTLQMSVPLKVDAQAADNWDEAH